MFTKSIRWQQSDSSCCKCVFPKQFSFLPSSQTFHAHKRVSSRSVLCSRSRNVMIGQSYVEIVKTTYRFSYMPGLVPCRTTHQKDRVELDTVGLEDEGIFEEDVAAFSFGCEDSYLTGEVDRGLDVEEICLLIELDSFSAVGAIF